MPDPILTDLPLVADEPVDIGVEDFCKICRKCANTCPTNSIPFGDKVVFNGIEKYKINWLTCYKLRPYVHEQTQCPTENKAPDEPEHHAKERQRRIADQRSLLEHFDELEADQL